jgi:cytochrome bd-type quinol oxidase subunit 1
MFYPQWEVPKIGGGLVIAIIAIVHVLVAHFAVGAGLFIAFTEARLARRSHPLLKDFLGRFGRFLVLLSFVFGVLTGVGIWFAIGLAAPRATSILIHNFVWGWAAEWALFAVEIAAGYVYYYGFDVLPDRRRCMVAWIYALAAWGSLVIINGILCFMLTPGTWLETHAFWDGFFNPTYWPSLVLRTISSMSLAAIFVAIVANGARAYDREQARVIINHAAWFLAPLVLMVPVAVWFFANTPAEPRRYVMGAAIAMHLFFMFGLAASTLIGFYAFIGLIWNKRYIHMETAVLLLGIAFIATGSIEFMREGIRKPFVIYDYLYSNGWTKAEVEQARAASVLARVPWAVPVGRRVEELKGRELGRAVYQAQCSQCHNLDGVNDVKQLVAGWNEAMIWNNLQELHRLKSFMPPLVGTEAERKALVEFLLALNDSEAASGARMAAR